MKKILLTVCILFACAKMAFGQVTISTSDLIGTKWQLLEDYESHSSEYYEFTKNALIWHRSDNSTFSYPYYLSAAIPTTFDSTKVGIQTKGCYFIEYNNKMDYFYCDAIMSFNKSAGKMVCKVMNNDVIGLSETVTYILMKQ